MNLDNDVFISQRGGKIQLEPIKSYVKGSYEFPMQPILLNNNIAAVQDTFLFDVQEQHKVLEMELIEAQTNYNRWIIAKDELQNSCFIEKQKYSAHKEKFSKFIEENRTKMKRSQRKTEEDVKMRIQTEEKIGELVVDINKQQQDYDQLVGYIDEKKDLELVLEDTLKSDPHSSCFTISSWIGHIESLLVQQQTLLLAIQQSTSSEKTLMNEQKHTNDSSISIEYKEMVNESVLETNQISTCVESLGSSLKCKPEHLQVVIKEYTNLLKLYK